MNKADFIYTKANQLCADEVFVFGSNLAGRHGKGAAKFAHDQLQYPYGISTGLHGNAYGIPTKGHNLEILGTAKIHESVRLFYSVVESRRELIFIVTPIGCGLAGYRPEDIAPIFSYWHDIVNPDNVIYPTVFTEYI